MSVINHVNHFHHAAGSSATIQPKANSPLPNSHSTLVTSFLVASAPVKTVSESQPAAASSSRRIYNRTEPADLIENIKLQKKGVDNIDSNELVAAKLAYEKLSNETRTQGNLSYDRHMGETVSALSHYLNYQHYSRREEIQQMVGVDTYV